MAQRYSPETIEAIWALLCEGIGPAEIKRRLAQDRAGLGHKINIPKRTLADHVARLKKARGEPKAAVRPGEEIEAAEAIRRRGIELLGRELARIEAKAAANPLNERDAGVADRIVRAMDDIKRRDAKPPTKANRNPNEAIEGATSTLLERLGREMDREAAQKEPYPNGNGDSEAASRGAEVASTAA